jgi:hypothetical protein
MGLFAAECSEHDNRLTTEQGRNYADDTRVLPGNADIIVLPAGTDTDKEYLENHMHGISYFAGRSDRRLDWQDQCERETRRQ